MLCQPTLRTAIKRLAEMPEPAPGEDLVEKMVRVVESMRGWFDRETKAGIIQNLRDSRPPTREAAVTHLSAFLI